MNFVGVLLATVFFRSAAATVSPGVDALLKAWPVYNNSLLIQVENEFFNCWTGPEAMNATQFFVDFQYAADLFTVLAQRCEDTTPATLALNRQEWFSVMANSLMPFEILKQFSYLFTKANVPQLQALFLQTSKAYIQISEAWSYEFCDVGSSLRYYDNASSSYVSLSSKYTITTEEHVSGYEEICTPSSSFSSSEIPSTNSDTSTSETVSSLESSLESSSSDVSTSSSSSVNSSTSPSVPASSSSASSTEPTSSEVSSSETSSAISSSIAGLSTEQSSSVSSSSVASSIEGGSTEAISTEFSSSFSISSLLNSSSHDSAALPASASRHTTSALNQSSSLVNTSISYSSMNNSTADGESIRPTSSLTSSVNPTAVNGTVFTTTVTGFTTYCPSPTTFCVAKKCYTVTEATTITITDCPCTLTSTVGSSSNLPICNGTNCFASSSSRVVASNMITKASANLASNREISQMFKALAAIVLANV